jgi:N-acetyl-anhydromuramyl-L-alanine amidase AmpD
MHLFCLYADCITRAERVSYAGRPHLFASLHDGRQAFYAYFIVRMDGGVERLLADNEIGWQAGKWEVNCRSVGIVLDNDLEDVTPPDIALDGLAQLIREHYPHVSHDRIFGHREVNPKTTCPSEHFLSGWKKELLMRLL